MIWSSPGQRIRGDSVRLASFFAAALWGVLSLNLGGELRAESPPTGQQTHLDGVKKQLAAQIETLRQELIARAAKTQGQQRQLQTIESRLAALIFTEESEKERLMGLRKSLTKLAITLQKLARRPPEAIIVGPGSAIDTARAALLLESAVARVSLAGQMLRVQIDKTAEMRRTIETEQENLRQMTAVYRQEQQQLEALLAEKSALLTSSRGAAGKSQEKLAALARSAKSFRGLLQKLQTSPEPPALKGTQLTALRQPPAANFSTGRAADGARRQALLPSSIVRHKGHLSSPAIGRVVQRFGDPEMRGQTAQGIKIKTRPGAPVVALYDGHILYADFFRSYGKILIIDHGYGYHTLLAGLGRIYSTVGQAVLAGEPVGVMNQKQGTRGGRPEMYLEIRHNGSPIDPLPWLVPQILDADG